MGITRFGAEKSCGMVLDLQKYPLEPVSSSKVQHWMIQKSGSCLRLGKSDSILITKKPFVLRGRTRRALTKLVDLKFLSKGKNVYIGERPGQLWPTRLQQFTENRLLSGGCYDSFVLTWEIATGHQWWTCVRLVFHPGRPVQGRHGPQLASLREFSSFSWWHHADQT